MTRAALFLFVTLPLAAAPYADRGEYDLILAIRSEGAAQKQLALLDQWKLKYPNSQMAQVRRELYLSAYQSLSDAPHMLGVVREILAAQPDNALASYWCVALVPGAKESSPELWKLTETAAHRLLDSPPADAPWQAQKAPIALLAHRALGWIAWQRADGPATAAELTAYLKQQPADAEVSSWYGMSLASQKKPETIAAAVWQLTRAAGLTGAGALPESQKRQLEGLSERIYVSFHGEADGLEPIRAASLAAAFPPADFKIESAESLAARRADEQLKQSNPQLYQWTMIRRQLESLDGDRYFAETLKPAPLPKLKGVVIACAPPDAPTEIQLGLGNGVTPEVTLKFEKALPACAPTGTEVQFEGAPESYAKSPFKLTVLTDPTKLDGWPQAPAPAKK